MGDVNGTEEEESDTQRGRLRRAKLSNAKITFPRMELREQQVTGLHNETSYQTNQKEK